MLRHSPSSAAALLTMVVVTAALSAQGTPIGFEETWALSPDRQKALATLIPGTSDWYYYHCRERLDARDFQSVRQLLPTWIERHGRSQQVIEIEHREALLSFGDDAERTYDYLRRQLGTSYDHQRVVPGAKSDLPTALDPNALSPTLLTQRALANHPGSVQGFTQRALPGLAGTQFEPNTLRDWLQRLDRPDVDNLPALVVRELERRESGGFGSLPIHGQLRRAQLEECLRLRPGLLQDPRFVAAYLTRLQPDADLAWQLDPAARAAQLQRVWEFVQRLSPAFNSLKAHVLGHWLQHDLSQGKPDRDRFLAYIRLPRRDGHTAKALLDRVQRADEYVDLRQTPPTLLPALRSDDDLLRACLEHFFASEDNFQAYAEFLDGEWLQRVFAETKLLLGQGDLERMYSLLGDPSRTAELERRVELRFPADLRTHFAADDAVQLALETKNVRTLLVKVFAIDAFRYHQDKQKEVDASIDLDGVVANFEQTFDYTEPPMRRVRRSFDLPMLREAGTYVVEFVGNGISSRAVVHKGELRLVERTAAGGQLLRVYDEAGRHVKTASAWFGGRDYLPDERGEILVPFSTRPGDRKLVLRAGNRSSMATMQHRGESYALHGNAHVEREQLVAGQKAKVLVRPQLQLDGHEVALELLQQRVLVVIATDLDGLQTTQEVRDPQLVDERELVHEITVPERLQSLQVVLRGMVKDLAGKDVPLSGAVSTFTINGIDATAETGNPLLLRTSAGYAIELRGKNGEPQAGRVCQLHLQHRDYVEAIDTQLQSDAAGRILLGALPGCLSVRVQPLGGTDVSYDLTTARVRLPDALQGRVGDTLRVPLTIGVTAPSRSEFSLLGHERDEFARLSVQDGMLELRELPPGDYTLHLHATGAVIPVRITRGERDGGLLVGRDRILGASPQQPLQLRQIAVDGQDLVIRVQNGRPSTRVHVIATRYVPTTDPFRQLAQGPALSLPAFGTDRAESSYHAGRKLGDEYRYVLERRFATKYAGNMLARPSLLLNPWRLDDSSNAPVGLGGGAGGRFGGRGGGGRAEAPASENGAMFGFAGDAGAFANLDFLPRAAGMRTNLTVAADGTVRVPLADLGAGSLVHVLALDGAQAVRDTLVRDETPLVPRPRALPQALDGTQHFVEQKRIEFVAAGATTRLDDARSAQVEIHDSLGSAFRLLTTISKDAELAKFAFLLEWPTLKPERQRQLYSEHACHELHFFLFKKDPEFFAAVVKPLLANKLDKTFLDHWLLGDDLRGWLEPWTFARLNLIERILLAQRLGGAERDAIVRSLREGLELRPVDRDRLSQLFDLALASEQLADKAGAVQLLEQLESRAMADAMPSPSSPGPAGPTTGGVPGAPAKVRAARSAAPMQDSKEKKQDEAVEEQEAKAEGGTAGADDFYLGQMKDRNEELRRRGTAQPLYREVARTKVMVEHNWWHRRLDQTTPDVVAPNQFWLDFATAPAGLPFASPALVQASTSVLEMLMALAVLDLPFTPGKHEITADGPQRTLRAASPLLLVRKEVAKVEAASGQAPLLVGQNFFRLDDRYRFEGEERRDAFVTDEFLVGVPYGCQIVVTNPTSSRRAAEVLLQIPAGAVPVQKGFWQKGIGVELAPYATRTIEYAFYFPATGEFAHYPVHAAEKGKLVANAEPRTLRVVAEPSKVDTGSWEHVSQQGTAAEVMAHLDNANIQRLDLGRIAWRMKDREFFTATLAKLRDRHVYDETLWSYALLHRDQQAAREYLRHADGLLQQCGSWLRSSLVDIDPVERHSYQHLELDPLVHARAHQLGSQRMLGNQHLVAQYGQLLNILGYHPTLDSNDWLVVTYYLLLQDRIEEGLAAFAKVDPAKVTTAVQYDYLAAYLCFFTGDTQKARGLAEKHKDHPVVHWQQRFRTVLTQLDEAAGKGSGLTGEPIADAAAKAPALELAVSGTTLSIAHKNLDRCEVRYYELDVEFAFSAQPFASADGTAAAFVQPTLSEQRELPKGETQLAFELPERFRRKNVLVEVRAQGLVRSKQYFANAMSVRFLESFGQVAVTTPDTQAPLPKTYVKVFAKLADGTVRFHKDGYTDLRGRFDYASLSDDPNAGAQRYAVLVLDEQRGALIREVAPPAK